MRRYALCLVLAFSGLVSAQEFRATITGLVTDPSGAPVAGAKVEVRSVERQSVFETQTNESGRYLTRFLAPGDYALAVSKDGFKKAVRETFALSAADRCAQDNP